MVPCNMAPEKGDPWVAANTSEPGDPSVLASEENDAKETSMLSNMVPYSMASEEHMLSNMVLASEEHNAIVAKAKREAHEEELKRVRREQSVKRNQMAALDAVIIAATERMHMEARKKEREKEVTKLKEQKEMEKRNKVKNPRRGASAAGKAMMFMTKAPQVYENLPIREHSKSLAAVLGYQTRGGFYFH